MEPSASAALRLLFDEIDQATAHLARATGLSCPPACGACCLSPNVEATELELIPLAEALFARGEGVFWLERLRQEEGLSRCVLYLPDPSDPARGRCGQYADRPTLCRLFAFAARRSREGLPQLAACRVHKQEMPEAVACAAEWIAAGGPVPVFGDIASRVQSIDPALGTDRLPINEALRRALERVGLRLSFAAPPEAPALTGVLPGEGPDDPPAPPEPNVPPRLAA